MRWRLASKRLVRIQSKFQQETCESLSLRVDIIREMIYYANPLKELYFRVAGAVRLAFSRRHDHFWVIND